MKKVFLLSIFMLAVFRLSALSGGPDQFGYTWRDSNDSLGPAFHWIDIVSSDREVHGLGDDNVRGPYSTSTGTYNPFRYYWYDCDKLWVGSNGYISFGNISLASIFPNIPNSTDNKHDFIAAMLTDLTFTGTGNQGHCYLRVTTDSIVVSWINVPFYTNVIPYWTGNNTFQIILDKTDRSITFNYLSQAGVTLNTDVKSGIENITGNIGLQPTVGTYPPANYVIKFYYPAAATYTVTDGSAKWNTAIENRGVFVPRNAPFPLRANIANSGNVDIPPVYTATGRIKDYSGNSLLVSSVNFNNTLTGGADTSFNYPVPFLPTASGIHSFTTKISGVQNDAFPSNDSVTQEVVVVDTNSASYSLNYTDNTAENSLAWSDGMGGIAMYFVPPSYPVKIASTKFFINDNPSGANFIAKIYDDNGPNGSPGTLLDSVASGFPQVGFYNLITTANNVVVTSGGIYVVWEMHGIDITLGSDLNPPFSLRSYEYISGMFSEYRNSQLEDFLITVNAYKVQKEDVAVPTIVSPANNATISTPTTVTCWLKNKGQLPETNFPVSYRLLGGAAVTETYTGPAIPLQDSVQFTFATPIQPGLGISGSLCVYSNLQFDFNRANDTTCIYVNIAAASDDLGVSQITSPANNATISSPTTVSCWVKNYGQLDESNFFVNYKLTGGTTVQEAYTGSAIQPQDSVLFTFATKIQPGVGSNGPFCVWTNLASDADALNDTACIYVNTVAATEDIGVSKILTPGNNALISSPVTVVCRIKNYGQVAESNFTVSYKLTGVNAVTEPYTGLIIQPGDSSQFTFLTTISPGVGSTGKFCVWTTLGSDATHSNDTSCINVQTTYGIDELGQSSEIKVFPNPFDENTIIEFSNPDQSAYELLLVDMLGNIVKNERGIKGNKILLEKGNLSPGIYTLQLTGTKNYRARIVVQ